MSAIGDVVDSMVDVATRVGTDFPLTYREVFMERGIDLAQWTCESHTTRFILDYTVKPRGLAVGAVCDMIEPTDIPESGCVIFSPIVGEINEAFLGSVEPDFLALDPQGLVRKIHGDGSITIEPWRSNHLNRVDLLKTSIREHFYLTGEPDPVRSLGKIMENGVEVAVITLGDGDCFLAALSCSLFRGEPLHYSCALASAVASSVVETRGPFIELSGSKVTERAEKLHEKIQRV
jgi:hypothetical protein